MIYPHLDSRVMGTLRLQEFYENIDVPFLSGIEIQAANFDDSTLGKTLHKIFEVRPKRVVRAAALSVAIPSL